MLTLFSHIKSFQGHFGIIQRNAIKSWMLLRPRPEILVFGNGEDTGVAEKEFGLRHVPEVARSEHGLPLLNDLFHKGESLASHGLLCFLNADIILMNDFMEAVGYVLKKQWFLMVGRRWNTKIDEPLRFHEENWETNLKIKVQQSGIQQNQYTIDYFVFHKGLFGNIPAFVMGIPGYDNWLIYRARNRCASVIDASPVVMAVHQNHDYSHHPLGQKGVSHGTEAQRNLRLIGNLQHIFSLHDATLVLTERGLRMCVTRDRFYSHLKTMPVLYPRLKYLVGVVNILVKIYWWIRSKT